MKRRHLEIGYSEYPVFVTTTIVEWMPVFGETWLAEKCLYILEETRRQIDVSIMAFALMPNHFHGLIRAKRDIDLSKFMQRWKSLAAREIINWARSIKPYWIKQFQQSVIDNKRGGKQAHQVWLPRFDVLPILDDRQFYAGLNYIHFNPERHLLTNDPEKYPYSSIYDYKGQNNKFVKINRGLWNPRSEQALTRENSFACADSESWPEPQLLKSENFGKID
jgi:REP element-mobilizing transposase RayT